AAEMREYTDQLGLAINQVADGVAQQQAAAGPIKQALVDMDTALDAANQSLAAMVDAAGRATLTARDGGTVIGSTVASIESVRAAVAHSAEQVAALGQRSAEIGQIVEAIDDIAEQTNLL